jgi:hypothetical protein
MSVAGEDVMTPVVLSATPYAALNAVLSHFVPRVRDLLADNFVGAYLQGSFALGDFDEHSDVDFLVVVRDDIPDSQIPALDALHAAIHDFPPPWGHRLEGSYIPAAIVRRRGHGPGEPLLFLDHGARSLVRSEHDDTNVVRWITRERGIVLAGPDPRELVDEVSAEALRREMRENIARWPATWFPDAASIEAHWMQALIVVTYCRMLHTLQTGTVTSKRASAAWALRTFDVRWHRLIASSLSAKPSQSLGPADPHAVAETLAFVAYCTRWAENLQGRSD